MNLTPLRSVIDSFSDGHRRNLATILDLEDNATVDGICETVRWMYRSRVRAKFTSTAADGLNLLKFSVRKGDPSVPTDVIVRSCRYSP